MNRTEWIYLITIILFVAFILILTAFLEYKSTKLYEELKALDCEDQKNFVNEYPHEPLIHYHLVNCKKI